MYQINQAKSSAEFRQVIGHSDPGYGFTKVERLQI